MFNSPQKMPEAQNQQGTAENGQEAEPAYIQVVQSPDNQAPAEIQNWQAGFTQHEMIAALSKLGHKVNKIDSVQIVQKGPSGRAVQISINNNLQVPGPELRNALGSQKLKSTLIDKAAIDEGLIVFTGKGYGHGVGMSQWGAYSMAASGKTAADIINYYFKGVKLTKRWQ